MNKVHHFVLSYATQKLFSALFRCPQPSNEHETKRQIFLWMSFPSSKRSYNKTFNHFEGSERRGARHNCLFLRTLRQLR